MASEDTEHRGLSLISSLPDRPLRKREGDRIRQHPRIQSLLSVTYSSAEFDGERINLLFLHLGGDMISIAYDQTHGGWHSAGSIPDLNQSEFESAAVHIAREMGLDVSERDRAGNERPYR